MVTLIDDILSFKINLKKDVKYMNLLYAFYSQYSGFSIARLLIERILI